jgi:hypothetical protein
MASVQTVCKKLSALFFASTILLASSVAEGAATSTTSTVAESQIAQDSVTSGVLMRADAEIQIRRIKNFMASKKTDADKEIEQLEKLQKVLHGQN